MGLRNVITTVMRPLAILRHRINPGARILMYHRVNDFVSDDYANGFDQLRVTPAVFDDQMNWLKHNRHVVSTSTLVANLRAGTDLTGQVAITFDDGYLDNLNVALPVLEKYQLPATIYVTSEFASQSRSHYRYPNEAERLHMNWDEITELSKHPLITIGSHTVSHPMLSELDQDTALREIRISKMEIEKHIGQPVQEFCYPSGNFTWREEQMAKDCEYTCAVTVKPGVNRPGKSLFTLRRTEITDKDNSTAFPAKMDGALDLVHRLLDLRREVIFSRNRQSANQ